MGGAGAILQALARDKGAFFSGSYLWGGGVQLEEIRYFIFTMSADVNTIDKKMQKAKSGNFIIFVLEQL